jgi:hypothetical protein
MRCLPGVPGSPSADQAPTETPDRMMRSGVGLEGSVARSLRTQQRVRRLRPAPAFHSPKGCTGRHRTSDASIDVPPMSYLGRTYVCTRGSARPANRSSGAP